MGNFFPLYSLLSKISFGGHILITSVIFLKRQHKEIVFIQSLGLHPISNILYTKPVFFDIHKQSF